MFRDSLYFGKLEVLLRGVTQASGTTEREEVFGWVTIQGGRRKTKFRGRQRVDASFTMALVAYNLIRHPKRLARVPS